MLHGLKLFWSSSDKYPMPRLLVLDPSILVKAKSVDELMKMHHGLIVMGLMMHRVWVWPPLDCHGKRSILSSDPKHWMGSFDSSILPYGGPKNLKCLDLTLTWNYCMEVQLLCSDSVSKMKLKCFSDTRNPKKHVLV